MAARCEWWKIRVKRVRECVYVGKRQAALQFSKSHTAPKSLVKSEQNGQLWRRRPLWRLRLRQVDTFPSLTDLAGAEM